MTQSSTDYNSKPSKKSVKMPVMSFDGQNMPSPGLYIVHPQIAKAAYRAYYEHTKSGKPITEFKYEYTLTEEDLKPYL